VTDPTQTPAPSLAVDRLSLHVPTMSAEDAQRLAEQVAESLRRWPAAPAASGRIRHVEATVPASAPPATGSSAATPAALADQIASAILEAALRELGQP
jgi:hypothetical protein